MKTRKPFVFAGFALVLFFFSSGCFRNQNIPSCFYPDRLNWSERNHEILSRFMGDYGKNGKYYDRSKPPYAVFDWDQTCIFSDVEDALFHFQTEFLRFRMTPQQFRTHILKDTINGITALSGEYRSIILADIHRDLVADYEFLYHHFSGIAGSLPFDQIRENPQYGDFLARLPFLYDGYCGTPGIGAEYGYFWVLSLLSGYTTGEVQLLAEEAINSELGNNVGTRTWHSPSGYASLSGEVSCTFRTGLRVSAEMQNLISTLALNGIDVYIVSASYKPVVEIFSGAGKFGYNVPAERVIAMELETDEKGIIHPPYKSDWVKTYGRGKGEAINRVIRTGYGRDWDPLFSAGDSDGDIAMLTGFPGTKLSLVWNNVNGGEIGELCKQAVDEMNSPDPRYILQGRNENTGLTIPSSGSVLYGRTEPQLLSE
jgi:phosphoserine phosphatase